MNSISKEFTAIKIIFTMIQLTEIKKNGGNFGKQSKIEKLNIIILQRDFQKSM